RDEIPKSPRHPCTLRDLARWEHAVVRAARPGVLLSERPMSDQAFDDADDLPDAASDADLAATVASLVRADLGGDQPGAVLRSFSAAGGPARVRFARAWNDAMDVDGLGDWIAGDGARRPQAEALAPRLTPPDPAAEENQSVLAQIGCFSSWEAYTYSLIVVP